MTNKVLLLNVEGCGEFSQHLPFGCLFVADALRKAGYDPVILHDEATPELHERVLAEARDCLFVGFSVKTDQNLLDVVALSRGIAELGVPVVWGGIHPTLAPESVLRLRCVDYVIRGEGEVSAPLLADAIRDGTSVEGIRGVGHRANGEFQDGGYSELAPDLDAFDPPWHLVDLARYVRPRDGRFYFVESRGCPYDCIFCYNTAVNRRRWRSHSVEWVLRHLETLREATGFRHVSFTSDNFFVNKKRAFEIVERLQTAFDCRLTAEYVDERFLVRAKRAGCQALYVGAESGAESFVESIKKGNTTLDDYVRAAELCTKYRVFLGFSFILGFPYESEEERVETLQFMLRLHDRYDCSVGEPKFLNPYPGTEVYTQAVHRGWVPPTTAEEWAENTRDNYILPFIPPERIGRYETLFDCFRILAKLRDLRRRHRWSAAALWPLRQLVRLRVRYSVTLLPLEIRAYDGLKSLARRWRERRRASAREPEAAAPLGEPIVE